uniref:RNA-directed DNA polymerase n=1 Tax=Strongyloides stercoralis TaxID=6248 RepID=A0A0K0EJ17_STRER
MLVDTGSEITILPLKFKNSCKIDKNKVKQLKTLNENGVIESYETKEELTFNDVDKSHSEVQKIKEEFNDIFAKDEFDLGSGKVVCQDIKLKNNAVFPKPTSILVQEVDKPILKEYLDKLEASGVIIRKPSPYAMPIIVLNKSDGRRRIIEDMRSINAIVKPIYYFPSLINRAILKMRSCSYFTKLDCNNAYFQIGVPENSQQYLAVKTPYGVYKFKRMVQGFINSASKYQRLGEELLQGLEEYCTNYLDDFVVHTAGTLQFHINKVKEVLMRIRNADFRISFNKCNFFGKSIKYLGFKIDVNGSIPHESNIKSLMNRPFPESKKALKSLLASANYYRNYIKNFSEKTYKLDDLLKKKYRKLVWNDEAKESYHKLIKAMSNPEFCHHPKLEEDFILTIDSSDHSIGGVLSQIRNGKEVPISFYSKRLSPTKRKRCSTYRESRIHIRTDHLPLIGIFKKSDDSKYLELTNDLAGYDFQVHYLKGSSNVIADDLSRESYKANDLNFSGDEDDSDKEANEIKCINVNDLLNRISLEDYDTSDTESLEEIENINDESEVNVSEVKRPRGRPKKKPSGRPKGSKKKNDISKIPEADESEENTRLLMKLLGNENGNLNVDFKENQRNDTEIQESLESGIYDKKKVVVVNDIVHVETKQPQEGQELKRIIPKGLFGKVLCLAHDKRGHFSKEKVKHLISKVGYMKSLDSVVGDYISRCHTCMRRNSPNIRHPKMNQVDMYTMPFQNLSADVLGPIIPTSSSGNKFLLVFIDCFTRYTIIIPCSSYSFDEIFQKVMDNITWKFGNLLSVKTDNGKNFKNEKLAELFKLIGIKHEFTSAYHSRGNSICERALKWIQCCLAKLSKSKREKWDIYTQAVAYYYNTTVCTSHGFTPFYLNFLRDPNTGMETIMDITENYKVDKYSEISELIDVAKETYELVKENIDKNLKKERKIKRLRRMI